MKKIAAACFLVFVGSVAGNTELRAQQAVRAVTFEKLDPGLEVFQGQVNTSGGSASLTAVRASISMYSVGLLVAKQERDGDTLIEFQRQSNSSVLLSGGFLKSFFPAIPLGLVISKERVVNRSVSGDELTGILVLRDGVPAIRAFGGDRDVEKWQDALQSGPLLISDGRSQLPPPGTKLLPSTQNLIEKQYNRAFVALLPDNRVLMGITGPITLPALVELLTQAFGSRSAVNLSGAGSAGLLVRAGGRLVSVGSVETQLPNAISLSKRP